jgi:hypothetical protein
MIQRCTNPNVRCYRFYGARGVKVCQRWLASYDAFLNDMGRAPSPSMTLDRWPDPSGDYRPGNVRWASWEQQRQNRRKRPMVQMAMEFTS